MNKGQAWFQIFLAALQAFLQAEGSTIHGAASNARATADEAMQHLHPDVLDIETNKVVPITSAVELPQSRADLSPEDELEQARRQAAAAPGLAPAQAEDDVSQATR